MRPAPQLSPCSITGQSLRRRRHHDSRSRDRETTKSRLCRECVIAARAPPSRPSPGKKPPLDYAIITTLGKRDCRSSMEVAVRAEAEGDCARRTWGFDEFETQTHDRVETRLGFSKQN
ncbi:hypothetical protein VIGAN_01282700 [Vigna angularis var. angularis]|uniref:Uncharacterized protein n=1 Tax=Vigna angularis var. angularis TaxID=157739 RepID=A0A0S3R3B9_PHAAN|nr:hypothetical protein VIGAN_01282700 [Vigna angularis var. angularis]